MQTSSDRALIARFFLDLRQALRLTLPQAAYHLQVEIDVIEALETGAVEHLPPWADTSAIVMTYASMAGVNGKPALIAINSLLSRIARSAPPARPAGRTAARTSNRQFVRAGSAIARSAGRLPREAISEIRRRPQRALYALSLPLGLFLLMLHTSIFDVVSKPFASTVRWVSVYFQEHFAPMHEGFRWIEVDDPRSRRGDKLRIGGGSY